MWTELCHAIENEGSLEEITRLLDRGALTIANDSLLPLTKAVTTGRKDIMLLLLDRGVDINAVGGKYGTALVAAVHGKSIDIVSLLLDRGANINMVAGECGTALATAVYGGSADMVSLLLDRGANINMVAGEYGTALTTAVHGGIVDMVSLLLDQGADVNAVGGDGTALSAAVCNGSADMVSLLLDRGADINMVVSEYGTALAMAMYKGGTDMVSLLLDQGADINMVGGQYGTALAVAVQNKSIDIVSLLLDRGADVNAMVGKYGTALAVAVYYEGADMVSLLLDRGADINMVGGEYGTALGTAVYHGNTDMVSMLLDRGAQINILEGECYGTELAVAVYNGGMDVVSLLLDRGASINAVDGEYGTALAAAVYNGNVDMVSLLLDQGADINMEGGEYGTVLAMAVYSGSVDMVSLLLERGADINMVGGEYGTALATAVYGGSADMVLLLLDRGADINMVGGKYGTALAAAASCGNTDIVLLLLEHGADVIHAGGSYLTASGVYPSALDAAHSRRSRAQPALLALLQTAIGKLNEPGNQSGPRHESTAPNVDIVKEIVSRPPFPMPHAAVDSGLRAGRCLDTLPQNPSSSDDDILSTEFHVGGNITPAQANVPCQGLDEEVLWRSLAALVGLSERMTQAKLEWIRNDVCYFASCNFDFGLAYAAARVAWKHFNEYSMDCSLISIQRAQWHKHAHALDEARLKAIETDYSFDSSSGQARQELIVSPYSIMPRRLWDLKSNRVVDFRMLHAAQSTTEATPTFWAVTHSWTSDMSPVWTAINQYQWPVPLPEGIGLDFVRSELLGLGAEYVWLDVVCLRQQSEDCEVDCIKREEWKLDVPTIGNIYRAAAKIVRYFNGLGVRFCTEGWDDSRHWLHRAWTLQEIANENTTINAGISRDRGQVLLNSQGNVLGKVIKLRDAIRPVIQLAAQVDGPHGCEVYKLAREMTKRHASKPVDKISGLFYLLRTTKLPCYDAQMTSEDFWRQCFHLLPPGRKAEILFDFPYRGSDEQWFPTWAQVLGWPKRDPACQHVQSQYPLDLMTDTPGETSFFIRSLWTIPHTIISQTDNAGEYEVKISNRLFGFYLPYILQKPIDLQDEPIFTLATTDLGHAHNWVVCRAVGKRVGMDIGLPVDEVYVLKKVGVIRTDTCSELLVGGEHGMSLLRKTNCLFV